MRQSPLSLLGIASSLLSCGSLHWARSARKDTTPLPTMRLQTACLLPLTGSRPWLTYLVSACTRPLRVDLQALIAGKA